MSSLQPSQTSSSSVSTPSTDKPDDLDDQDDQVWDMMDALYLRKSSNMDDSSSLGSISSFKLDGVAFGARSSSENGSEPDYDIPHFPPLSEAMLANTGKSHSQRTSVTRTSEPITKGVQHDDESNLAGQLTREKFQQLLDWPIGLIRFREWVNEEGYAASKALFRYYTDSLAYASLLTEVSAITEAMQTEYFESTSSPIVESAPQAISTPPVNCLPALGSVTLGMHSAQTVALDKLYKMEFKRFIAGRLTEQAKNRLGHFSSVADRGDLGEVYCLANPRLADQPLVMVSDGFCRLSEYPRERMLGRNCRFLQGPATDPEAVRLLSEAISAGREHCCLLLNYTRTGKPFWNLFNMVPLRNASGRIDYFLGAQVDVSRALTSRETYDALTGIAERDQQRTAAIHKDQFAFSEDILSKTEKQLSHDSILRNLAPPTSKPKRNYQAALPTAIPAEITETPPTPSKMQRLLSNLSAKRSMEPVTSAPPSPKPWVDEGLEPVPIVQEVPDHVRQHMSAFSSAYSKILVFNASDRRIVYVTPPLLANLGHSVRTLRDRLSSTLLHTDILHLIAAQNSVEAETMRKTIRTVIDDRATHSLFVGLAVAVTPQALSSPRRELDRAQWGNQDFVRSLLHLTPVKDAKDVAQYYIAVMG